MKLGDYALRGEIDKAVQLVYEARQQGGDVDAYLRTPAMFGENAADRYDPVSQAIALALDGKAEDFRDLMMAYNRNAAHYADANQLDVFGGRPTKEEFINEFLKLRNWKNYETRRSENEGNGDVGGTQGSEPETPGGNEPTEGNGEGETINDRRRKEGLAKSGDKTLERKNLDDVSTEENGGALEGDKEGKPENDNGGSPDRDIQAGEEQREVEEKAIFEQRKAEYLKALKEGKTGKELENAKLHYKFSFLDYQNVMGVTDSESLEKLWERELESAKDSNGIESEEAIAILPKKEEKTFDPIGKAAENYKKDHPLTLQPRQR